MVPSSISVLTAFGRPEYDFLRQAGASVRHLASLRGHENVQWVISCDGPDVSTSDTRRCVKDLVQNIRVVSNDTGIKGPGPARTKALRHADGEWIVTLDADDIVYPLGVQDLIAAAENHDVSWAAGRCADLVNGRSVEWDSPDPFPPGIVSPGSFLDFKLRTGAIPFILNATVAKREIINRAGGWPLRVKARSEDTALWVVLTSSHAGVWVPVTAYGYRKHDASMTHAPGFRDLPEDLEELQRMAKTGNTQTAPEDD